MRPCEAMQDRLIDLHYGLLDGAGEREMRAHLSGCSGCAAALADLERLTGALRAEEAFPREAEVDWGGFARITVARAVASERSWLPRFRNPFASPVRPAWALAASLVVVAVIALAVSNLAPPLDSPLTDAGGPDVAGVLVPQDNLDHLTVNLARQNAARYLRETRAVLVTLLDVNIDCEKGKVDITAERAKATELLRRQRLIAMELNRLPLARAQDVCGDLERLLLEISSLADCARDEEITTLRDVVEKRQILVRMELLSQDLARSQGGSRA